MKRVYCVQCMQAPTSFLMVQLEEAEAFLRAAGVELPIDAAHKKSKHKEKDKQKKHKKHKKDRDGRKD